MSRYRWLRGMAFHVLPVLRSGRASYYASHDRQLVSLRDLDENDAGRWRRGRCFWCRLPVSSRRRTYCDDDCRKQRDAVLGNRVWPTRIDEAECAQCGEPWDPHSYPINMEVDHELAIHKARKMGDKALIAAFLLENLRWLCHTCHVAKTTADRNGPGAREAKRARAQFLLL